MLVKFIGVLLFVWVFFHLVFSLQSVKEQESKESNQIYSAAFLVRHLCSSLFHIQDIDIGKIDSELCSLLLWLIKLATLLSLEQAAGDFNQLLKLLSPTLRKFCCETVRQLISQRSCIISSC